MLSCVNKSGQTNPCYCVNIKQTNPCYCVNIKQTNKQNIKHTNPCPRCHGLAPPGPVLATKKSKKLQRKRRRTHFLLVFIIFVGSFSNPSSVLRITEMVVDFNSRIPTYLAKIFLGNELSISCQKLNTIHYSSSSSAFA